VAATFKFPKPKSLFTINTLGGWTAVNSKFFNPQTGVVAKIEAGQGVSTASG
jgi:ABC-type sulfate transport system substrate-binding protein